MGTIQTAFDQLDTFTFTATNEFTEVATYGGASKNVIVLNPEALEVEYLNDGAKRRKALQIEILQSDFDAGKPSEQEAITIRGKEYKVRSRNPQPGNKTTLLDLVDRYDRQA